MNILMISCTFPYPPTRGGTQVRTFNLLKYLSKRHSVTVVTQRDGTITDAEIAGLEDCVDRLVIFERPPEPARSAGIFKKLQRLSSFLQQGTPPSVLSHYSLEMQAWIDQVVREGKYDVITCEHSVNEIFVRPDFQKQVRTVVDIHSSVYGSCRNQLATGTSENKFRDQINLPLLRRYEQNYCSKFSSIVVTTQEDKLELPTFNSDAEITVIPNGVDLVAFPYRTADPGGQRLIFIGAMDILANIDAVSFFSTEVLPQIQKIYPDTTFEIVGGNPAPEVLALTKQLGITVTGRVPSMAEYLHKSTVCIVPMRTGFGIKNKTLEAMAAGVPIVGSDRGLEGLAVDGAGTPLRALRANLPAEYVTAISQLFDHPQLRHELSYHGRELIETTFTWDIAGQSYEQVCCG
jgi:glycosyltransferase involved in cell wall biosynthesis